MRYAAKQLPVKLIIGLITKNPGFFESIEKCLSGKFGPIDLKSPILPFNHTKYYEAEFGQELIRKFLSFSRLIKKEDLVRIKLTTDRIENVFSLDSKRKINIDPGYLSLSKLVLATRKDYRHRIYLGKGIFGEVTLYYQKNTFSSWDWTYPDYKTREYIDIFNKIRDTYEKQLGKFRNDKRI